MKTWEECPPPRGAADAAGVAAGKPPPREDVAAANEVDVAGTAAGVSQPREDVAAVSEVGAAQDENMGGMPSPRVIWGSRRRTRRRP